LSNPFLKPKKENSLSYHREGASSVMDLWALRVLILNLLPEKEFNLKPILIVIL